MPRRVLFVIRGKLGDTLVAFATVRTYVDAFPQDEVHLLTRANYAPLFAEEAGLRVSGFSNRLDLFWLLLRLRFAPRFDALLVLWGFGSPIKWIGRLVRSVRKIYLDARYQKIFTEYADLSPHRLQSEPMWRVACIFEPALPQPDRLRVPSLISKRERHPTTIGIAPLADEPRRIMDPKTLAALLQAVAKRHPGAPVRVFINATDRGAGELIQAGLPEGASFYFFPELDDLMRGFGTLAHLYCTDTGLYHLAASMEIPATVFYGPTQPWKNMMPAQSGSRGVRLTVLGDVHCEEKSCATPVCIASAVSAVAGKAQIICLQEVPVGCPLRAHPNERLSDISWHEDPRRQA